MLCKWFIFDKTSKWKYENKNVYGFCIVDPDEFLKEKPLQCRGDTAKCEHVEQGLLYNEGAEGDLCK